MRKDQVEPVIMTAPRYTIVSGRLINDWGLDCGPVSLIGAAPELLAALKAVVAISMRKHDAWDAALTAIAKAEGRTETAQQQPNAADSNANETATDGA